MNKRVPEGHQPLRQPTAPAKRVVSAVNLTPDNRLLRVQFGVDRLIRAEDERLVAPGLKNDTQPARGEVARFKLFDEQPVLLTATVRPPVGAGLA